MASLVASDQVVHYRFVVDAGRVVAVEEVGSLPAVLLEQGRGRSAEELRDVRAGRSQFQLQSVHRT